MRNILPFYHALNLLESNNNNILHCYDYPLQISILLLEILSICNNLDYQINFSTPDLPTPMLYPFTKS